MDEIKVGSSLDNVGDRGASWLHWAFMLLALSLVEGTLGHSNSAAGSLTISKISLILAISLFVMFHRTRKVE
jgi:uncharacterized membrane protein YtjA (UPF0391 family)